MPQRRKTPLVVINADGGLTVVGSADVDITMDFGKLEDYSLGPIVLTEVQKVEVSNGSKER